MKHILVTGGAGFIGSSLISKLLQQNCSVTAIDNFDPFYDKKIKIQNLGSLRQHSHFTFIELNILDLTDLLDKVDQDVDAIVHIAAKAGVHASISDPIGTLRVNVMGTQNMLEFARQRKVKQFVFASSSSVYGNNSHTPWKEEDHDVFPISPYASSKLSGEQLGHVYSELYGIRFLALRFFTVYGPRQRPDLAIHKFITAMVKGREITQYGDGSSERDYTYIDDIVNGVISSIAYDASPYEVFNLGNGRTISLKDMIEITSEEMGMPAKINIIDDQPGDVYKTHANIDKARRLLAYDPQTTFREGIRAFKDWYESYSGS